MRRSDHPRYLPEPRVLDYSVGQRNGSLLIRCLHKRTSTARERAGEYTGPP